MEAGLPREVPEVLLERPMRQEVPQDLIRFTAPRSPLAQEQQEFVVLFLR